MHDLVIRGGTIVDGSGEPAREGDVAIDGDRIASAGGKAAAGKHEVDARGMLVAPGWVDIHTHYDGQVTWDPHLTPSCWHGVTTVVMGNCGVGFAPARPDRHDWLIGLMEGVEDIPGTALADGIQWTWESFPEYLDAVEKIDITLPVGVGANVLRCTVEMLLPEALFPLGGLELVLVIQVVQYPGGHFVHRGLLLLLSGYERRNCMSPPAKFEDAAHDISTHAARLRAI